MLTLHPTATPVAVSTVRAGLRLDVHTVDAFRSAADEQLRRFGTVHIDASDTKHVDNAGLATLTQLVQDRRTDAQITIEAGPAVQTAALLTRNETLAAAILPLSTLVAA